LTESVTDGGQSARTKPALPLESGKPRVQRLVPELSPVHIELEPPPAEGWRLEITGLRGESTTLTLAELEELGLERRDEDFHCVWGWSKPRQRWAGVPAGRVFDATGLGPDVTHVLFKAFDSPYAACLPIDQARDGMFATVMGDRPLPPEHGGPLRWLQPYYLWGYKGVKWVCSAVALDHLEPGPWEQKVGDVAGNVPAGLIAMFDDYAKEQADVAGEH
jgi:DMSO/TMAO reductase YedYZ molybdopterin-dependent catalytic subunit